MKPHRVRDVILTAVTCLILSPLACLTLAIGPLSAQEGEEEPGQIRGRIIAAGSSAPVTNAVVRLRDNEIGTLSDVEGRYFLRDVPPGTYELQVEVIGYQNKTVTGVRVLPGEVTPLDVSLSTEAVAVEGITVSVTQERGSTAALLNEQRRAIAITDAIGSDEIARSPDGNAAESVRRMTGVTVADGKYVYVRGLGKRYSQTNLNGSPLPSPDPEKGAVPLDLFPAGFLESLTTRKTYTPDQPGDFSGGSVEIETKEFPDRFTFKLSLGSSLNTQSQFADGFLGGTGSGTDFLGFDGGHRGLPDAVREEIGGVDGDRLPADPEVRERLGEAFAAGALGEFSPRARSTPGNVDWGFSLGDRTRLFGKEFGYFVAGTYSNSFQLRDDEVERKFRASNFNPEIPEDRQSANVDFSFVRGIQDVNLGGIGNFTLSLSPAHQLSLKTLVNQNAEDEARRFFGPNREDLGGILSAERLRFVSRRLQLGQLSGEHRLPGGSRLEWKTNLARATRDEPGLRETIFRRGFAESESEPFTLVEGGESARYLFSELTDDDVSQSVDWEIPLPWHTEAGASVKVGGMARFKDRDFDARRFRFRFLEGSQITDLEEFLAPENIQGRVDGIGTAALDEIVEPGDNYTVDEDTWAGFGMLTLTPLESVRLVGGARLEDYSLFLDTRAEGGLVSDARLDETDVLPAVNLTWSLRDDMNLRWAFSETLDRPEFRELGPFQFTEATSLRQLFGNPDLQIASIQNFDFRWEFFPRPGEALSVSAFYKDLENPIEQVFIATAGTAYSFQNAESGEVRGIELGFRKRLDFLGPAFSDLTFNGNGAIIDSEVDVRTGGIFDPTNLERDLEGQSSWTTNLSLSYRSSEIGTQAGLYFNMFGERIAAAGGSNVPDIVEQPRAQLDFTLVQPVRSNWGLKVQAENLLDAEYRWEQSANGITRVQRSYHRGQSFSASLSFTPRGR